MGAEKASTASDQCGAGVEGQDLSLFKEYLSELKFRIKLDDLVKANVRAAVLQTTDGKFPLDARIVTREDIVLRLKGYEDAIRPLLLDAALLGKWATAEQLPTLTNMMARISDSCAKQMEGNTICLSMRWYPLSLLAYSAGLAALSVDNYAAFAALHDKRISTRTRSLRDTAVPIIVPVVDAMLDLGRANVWKVLAGHDRSPSPESEYLFQALRPPLDDLLFLGSSYDELFDRYEILRTLMYADLVDGGWAPIGRFGWKHTNRGSYGSPYVALRTEADQKRDKWGPIAAGLFHGSYERFIQVTTKFENEMLSKLNSF